MPAPGGTILRTDTEGTSSRLVAGGMRNPYDIAFNGDGELFTYDADMEWDIGTPWYRPTRVNHVPPGAELGWRSGWAKWPDYYLDSLPATLDVGAGSPTGIESYNHVAFPKKYQNALFVGDWALGQIHAVQLTRTGASYTANISTILKGRPLNVTDLAVGPDGALTSRPAAAAQMAAYIESNGRARCRQNRSIWDKESNRRCGSRSFKATGPAGRSHLCSAS